MHCTRMALLLYECQKKCFSCGYIVSKRKNERTKINEKKIINWLKYAEKRLNVLYLCF